MARATSPLRYPGGKSCLLELTSEILRVNKADRREYAEPYAGGCGLALALLFGGHVSDIHINDVDPAIWSFWHCVLNETEDLVKLIETQPISVEHWLRQREIFLLQDLSNPLELGFATFFLNRTNRSGIIKSAGIIGGLKQDGNYKMDCRFNREGLVRRIRRIRSYSDRIHLTRLDALDFLRSVGTELPPDVFLCVDPPYFKKGASLYTSFYKPEDHAAVAKRMLGLNCPWILTYDDAPEIRALYKSRRQFSFDINYSIQTKRVGTELLVASKGLRLPIQIRERQIHRPQYRAA